MFLVTVHQNFEQEQACTLQFVSILHRSWEMMMIIIITTTTTVRIIDDDYEAYGSTAGDK